ncbi:hypothetical protein TNIN_466951 [Trichonephila inaurata madagascariensis]|uniref:Uncharacterized protein n=1 Tax=Trichonephila inaurata madagascariensis TaxID=2747483 RepID=A0A8X7CUY1_9ARAC|nr:hypothetical protein TNIN_466951 [Trichonephila inaurata madagascariensis]
MIQIFVLIPCSYEYFHIAFPPTFCSTLIDLNKGWGGNTCPNRTRDESITSPNRCISNHGMSKHSTLTNATPTSSNPPFRGVDKIWIGNHVQKEDSFVLGYRK